MGEYLVLVLGDTILCRYDVIVAILYTLPAALAGLLYVFFWNEPLYTEYPVFLRLTHLHT